MERWSGRVAAVTGSSSGIGAAVCQELVKKGLKVVGLARRVERTEELASSLSSEKGKLYPLKCDVTNKEELQEAFKWIKSNLGGADIWINNAAVLFMNNALIDGSEEEWKKMLDLNVLGLSVCTKLAIQSMKERGVDDGHIVHVNSICGHHLIHEGFMYAATKHAVTALTEGLRRELVQHKSKIKITSVSPGLVMTEMPPSNYLESNPYLEAKDIADAVLYALGTPPHVQIHEIIIKPVGELF